MEWLEGVREMFAHVKDATSTMRSSQPLNGLDRAHVEWWWVLNMQSVNRAFHATQTRFMAALAVRMRFVIDLLCFFCVLLPPFSYIDGVICYDTTVVSALPPQ